MPPIRATNYKKKLLFFVTKFGNIRFPYKTRKEN